MSSPLPPPPQAGGAQLVHGTIEPRVVAAGAGASWWADGWRMFTSQIGTWIGIVIVYIVISWLVGKVPYIGGIAHWLLIPVFVGGIMLGCHALDRGEPLRLSHLFDGFKGPHFTSLLTVGALNLLLTAVAVGAGFVFAVTGIGLSALMDLNQLAADPWQVFGAFGLVSFLLLAVVLLLATVIFMVTWFAPALIVLQDARPLDAMKGSFRACMRNWAAFLIYGAIGVAIIIVAMCLVAVLIGVIGFGAFMAVFSENANWGSMIFGIVALIVLYVAVTVVVTPVVFGSVYAGYRDTLATEGSELANPAYR